MRRRIVWDRPTIARGILVAVFASLYLTVLVTRTGESARRSLRLHQEIATKDYVKAFIRIKNVNTAAAEITTRLEFKLAGRYAKDEVTPAFNLKVLLNSIRGPQEIDFLRGKRMNAIEAVFHLDGNQNDYPFDRHQTSVWLLVTTPGRAPEPAPVPQASKKGKPSPQLPTPLETGFGTAILQQSDAVHVSMDVVASIPGFRFEGNLMRSEGEVAGILLNLRRSRVVRGLSIVVMTMMLALAVSVFLMTLRATRPERELDLVPLSLAMTLLFGLPALRNIQPDVPNIGVFSDYVSFIWAELLVAFSSVAIVWIWMVRFKVRP